METGLHQMARQLSDPDKRAERFAPSSSCGRWMPGGDTGGASFYWNGARFIPTPLPDGDSRWDFSRPLGERQRNFCRNAGRMGVPSRNHLAALLLAFGLGDPVTTFDENPRRCRKVLVRARPTGRRALRILEATAPLWDYLIEMARHKIVIQADRSAVPGSGRGRCACSAVCLVSGGDGAIDRLAFPRLLRSRPFAQAKRGDGRSFVLRRCQLRREIHRAGYCTWPASTSAFRPSPGDWPSFAKL